MTPILVVAGIEPHRAAAASLFAILGTSLGGLRRLLRAGLVEARIGSVLAAAALAGAALGAGIAARLPGRVMLFVIAAAMYTAAATTVYRPRFGGRHAMALGIAFIFGGTMLSAMAGKGGGSFAVPVLISVVGLDTRRAAATARLVVLASAAASVTVYAAHGYLDPLLAAPLIAGTFTGSTIAARMLHEMSEERHRLLELAVFTTMGTLALAKALLH